MSGAAPTLEPGASPPPPGPEPEPNLDGTSRWSRWSAPARGRLGARPSGAHLIVALIVAAGLFVVGYLVVGLWIVPVAAAAAVASVVWRRDPGRPLAAGAVVLLAMAAIATVFVITPTEAGWTMTFAADRTLAASAGRFAGLLFGLASVVMAVTDRARQPAPRRALVSPPRIWDHRVTRRTDASTVAAAVALVAGGLALAIGLRWALAPPALSVAYDSLVTNLRFGTTFAVGLTTPDGVPATTPPLAPLVVAYVPVAARELAIMCGLLSLVVTARLALRVRGLIAGGLALALGAVLPAMWDVSLAVILAGIGLVAAVTLADGTRISTRRAVGAGLLLGVAVLARPETAVAAALVILWSWDRGARRGQLMAMAIAAVVTAAPWWVWLHGEFGGLVPASGLGAFLHDSTAVARHAPLAMSVLSLLVLAAGVALGRRRPVNRDGRQLNRDWWILWAVPVAAIVIDLMDGVRRDPLSWSMPLAVVLLATGAAQQLSGGSSSPPPRRAGAVTGPLPFGAARPDAPAAAPPPRERREDPRQLAQLGAAAFLIDPDEDVAPDPSAEAANERPDEDLDHRRD